MSTSGFGSVLVPVLAAALAGWPRAGEPRDPSRPEGLDARVRAFLDRSRSEWRDMNVPYEDGRVLHDLVVRKGFKRGLEIGTSTGHSAVWIAWAMSRTGGRLVTIEIDERRHRRALANFEAAGVSPYVDARLADAHVLVKELSGPFDFVFSDADKEWYTQYFKDVDGKMEAGRVLHRPQRPRRLRGHRSLPRLRPRKGGLRDDHRPDEPVRDLGELQGAMKLGVKLHF